MSFFKSIKTVVTSSLEADLEKKRDFSKARKPGKFKGKIQIPEHFDAVMRDVEDAFLVNPTDFVKTLWASSLCSVTIEKSK